MQQHRYIYIYSECEPRSFPQYIAFTSDKPIDIHFHDELLSPLVANSFNGDGHTTYEDFKRIFEENGYDIRTFEHVGCGKELPEKYYGIYRLGSVWGPRWTPKETWLSASPRRFK
jgi:hypothetical protein